MPTGSDDQLSPPYVAVIRADHGESLPLDQYAAVTIEVQVTSGTRGGAEPRLVREALRGSTPLNVRVHCDGGRFIAESISLSP
jgi:hypothetical protein